jgi:hypothetical protein
MYNAFMCRLNIFEIIKFMFFLVERLADETFFIVVRTALAVRSLMKDMQKLYAGADWRAYCILINAYGYAGKPNRRAWP